MDAEEELIELLFHEGAPGTTPQAKYPNLDPCINPQHARELARIIMKGNDA